MKLSPDYIHWEDIRKFWFAGETLRPELFPDEVFSGRLDDMALWELESTAIFFGPEYEMEEMFCKRTALIFISLGQCFPIEIIFSLVITKQCI